MHVAALLCASTDVARSWDRRRYAMSRRGNLVSGGRYEGVSFRCLYSFVSIRLGGIDGQAFHESRESKIRKLRGVIHERERRTGKIESRVFEICMMDCLEGQLQLMTHSWNAISDANGVFAVMRVELQAIDFGDRG